MPKYELSEQEVNALIDFIDIGLKAGGLRVANNGLILATKLSKGLQPVVMPPIMEKPNE